MTMEPTTRARIVAGVSLPVFLLGLTSFFTDLSSEMIQAIFPEFVRVVLGGSLVTLGLILGVTDALANLVKGLSGWLSERLGNRKGLVIAGYGLSNLVAKPLMGFQTGALPVLLLKATDRLGKGIRTSPRDALIGYHAGAASGKAFGIHRAMDTLGAVAGPLLAAVLLVVTAGLLGIQQQLSFIILFSIVPGAVAVVLLFFVDDIKQPKERATPGDATAKPPERISRQFVKTVAVLASIEFASLNTGFLIARAGDFFPVVMVAVLFAAFNVVYALVSLRAGGLSDRIGRKKVIVAGLVALLAVNLLLAIPWDGGAVAAWVAIPAAFGVFGIYSGMVDPTARALVSDLSERKKGKAYGLYYLFVGLVSIPETILFGFLWDAFGPTIAFTFVAVLLVACILVFAFAVPETRLATTRAT